ncbi:response regulator transcription factor [Tranquillimonas alkanivorans]|uniref:Two component transcriptional regulator, LuxR family n=1 Tax=Tranquillimonas alkanivorans TaxID=441119 RepID=A0A1I5MXP5_9RHOB|nr:response regulator transcription factor [Tranquillimonas alkanivorans]SFP14415.1 two component transcriptional regulator, LuxR family [Tranquillimonas alkanivorans]
MRVLVADDHDLVRETIAAYLESEGGARASLAPSLTEALERVAAEGAFDLVLLDYNMPGMDGLRGLARMLEANAGRPVAILSGSGTQTLADEAVASGAAGFVPKTLSSRAMIAAARLMIEGQVFLPETLEQEEEAQRYGLSRRETEMLRGICAGKSNKEIARDHDIQEVTVKLHVRTLSRKLGARNRTHAAMIARDRGLI